MWAEQNLLLGAKHFEGDIAAFPGSIDNAVAAYYTGVGNVQKYGISTGYGNPTPAQYVASVTGRVNAGNPFTGGNGLPVSPGGVPGVTGVPAPQPTDTSCDRSGNSFGGCFCGVAGTDKKVLGVTIPGTSVAGTVANFTTQTVPCLGEWFYKWVQRLGLIFVAIPLGLLGLFLIARDAGALPNVTPVPVPV